MRALLVVAMLVASSVAQADVWQHAVEGKQTTDAYDASMVEGDNFALRASARGQTIVAVSKNVDDAIDQYTQAAKARPTMAEPYYRIANVLETFFTDCAPAGMMRPPTCPSRGNVDQRRAQQTIDAWEAFEKRAPLDPRASEGSTLFNRAILRTKMVKYAKNPKPLLEAALADYRSMLDRADGLTLVDDPAIWGNLAETYMMLGMMDEAIESYRFALRFGADSATAYGLAVALDRDGSPAEALEVIREQPEEAFRRYLTKFYSGDVFYVPAGEEFYYLALVFEGNGRLADALTNWQQFIKSGAHPQFHARAKQHVDSLQSQIKTQPAKLQRQPYQPFEIFPLMKHAFVAVALLVLASPAFAQSKRYPPEPVDKDEEKGDRSELWENATNPQTKPYARLISEAAAAIKERTDDQRVAAIGKLDEAIKLVPDETQAYAMRGETYMELREWAKCADDLQVAIAKAPDEVDIRVQTEQRRKLGLCLARAGRLAHAERVLAEAAASGTTTGEMLMRLGEVRIAMGKLDEAITALTAATEATDATTYSLTRWLLMAAYDRARRPADAIAIGRTARQYDRDLTSLKNPPMPLIGMGEREYLLGLASEYSRGEGDPPEPEIALLYFRRFLKLAPESPWRKRADEHVRDLKTTVLPEAIARKPGGTAAFDLDVARGVVRKQMPALRACLTKAPNVVFTVVVTKSGPKQVVAVPKPPPPPTRYPYPTYRPYVPRPVLPPPDGVTVEPLPDSEPTSRADKDAAMRCIEPIVSKLPFAPIKEANAYVQFAFALISP